jgi:hypothetical protein
MDRETNVTTENRPSAADEPKPHDIKQEIDEHRAALTEMLETLENQVVGTVQNVKETVEETVENVKETVTETVQTVKRTFDLKYQVDRHPWAMLGGSLVLGYASGYFLGRFTHLPHLPQLRRDGFRRPERFEEPMMARSFEREESPAREWPPETPAPREPGLLARIAEQFEPEIKTLKGMAIGAVLGLVRDMVKESVPESISDKMRQVIDNITTKLGGTVVPEPVASSNPHRAT